MKLPDCPNCGEDELFSKVIEDWYCTLRDLRLSSRNQGPWAGEVIAGEFSCWVCNWTGHLPLDARFTESAPTP